MNPDLLLQWLAYAAPVCFAGLGGLISEKSGVVNIALEGQMLCGALAAAAAAALTGNPWLGALAGALAGAAASGLFAAFAVGLRRDQVIVGTTLNFLALGMTGVLARAMTKANPKALSAPSLPHLAGALDPVSLGSLVLVPVLWWWIHRTRAGVALRATGERPAAAAAGGFHV
ncbi:MAG: ABC transporter permease subunit, partial [Armatimonadota bacterium]